jgi:hypothetical protein
LFYTGGMSNKKSKKRTKRYQGEDAKHVHSSSVATEPVVHRYEAVERSRLGEWWNTKKRVVRLAAIGGAIGVGGTWLIVELFRLIF